MTEFSQTILDRYQVRKTKAQKLAFIDFLKQRIPDARVEEGGLIKSRNIIIGDPDNADIIFTAHYDTCARLPFPNLIMPKNIILTLLYGLAVTLPFLAVMLSVQALVKQLTDEFVIIYWSSLAAFMVPLFYVFFLGPANKHTVNDNTSGVVMLVEIMSALSVQERERTAFVLFDNEENGLLGSSYFAGKHKAALKGALVVNFDCVSDGDNILFVFNKTAQKKYEPLFKAAFQAPEGKSLLFDSSAKAFYPSDQVNFPVNVGVAALKKHRLFGYYLDRIHTKHDTVMDEANIKLLVEGAVTLTGMELSQQM